MDWFSKPFGAPMAPNETSRLALSSIKSQQSQQDVQLRLEVIYCTLAQQEAPVPYVQWWANCVKPLRDSPMMLLGPEPDWELEVPDCVANSLCWPSICDETADSQPAQQQFTNRFQGEGQESDGSKHPLWWQVFNPDGLLRSATTCYSYICVFVSFSTIFMHNIYI